MLDSSLITLHLIKGISRFKLKLILEVHNYNAKKALSHLKKQISISKKGFENIIIPDKSEIEKEIDAIYKKNAFIINFTDHDYPKLLKEIYTAPFCFTGMGNRKLLSSNSNFVGIVGSRVATKYSIDITRRLVQNLRDKNIITVSGLALGVDKIVHEESLSTGTISFLAYGINSCYPSENEYLMKQMIQKNGLILTEFSSLEQPIKQNFPKRNRLIAGSSNVIIIVEARIKSGTMITAKYANQYNKEVYAIPAIPTMVEFEGNNYLIANHMAKIIYDVDNIYDEIKDDLEGIVNKEVQMQFKFKEEQSNIVKFEVEKEHIEIIKTKILNFFEAYQINIDIEDYYILDVLENFIQEPLFLIKVALVELFL